MSDITLKVLGDGDLLPQLDKLQQEIDEFYIKRAKGVGRKKKHT